MANDELDPEPQPVKRGPGRPRKVATGNAGHIPARTETGKIMSERDMAAKVREELYLWLSSLLAVWELRDPICAGVLLEPVTIERREVERLEAIVDRLVRIIARNKKLLATMAKTGVYGDLAMLASLLAPVGRQVWALHGPTGQGHSADYEGEGQPGDDSTFPPYRPS